MKQEEKRERTKKQILNATKELIREKGCDQVTLNDIIERSELSKGAIFHYVNSKDELFSWVLKDSFEDTNERFILATQKEISFNGPMKEILARLPDLENPDDVGTQVFIYLLGKNRDPKVRKVIQQFYDHVLHLSRLWVHAGQEAGVIPSAVDANKTSELFVLISLGMRIRSILGLDHVQFNVHDFAELMISMLQPNQKEKE